MVLGAQHSRQSTTQQDTDTQSFTSSPWPSKNRLNFLLQILAHATTSPWCTQSTSRWNRAAQLPQPDSFLFFKFEIALGNTTHERQSGTMKLNILPVAVVLASASHVAARLIDPVSRNVTLLEARRNKFAGMTWWDGAAVTRMGSFGHLEVVPRSTGGDVTTVTTIESGAMPTRETMASTLLGDIASASHGKFVASHTRDHVRSRGLLSTDSTFTASTPTFRNTVDHTSTSMARLLQHRTALAGTPHRIEKRPAAAPSRSPQKDLIIGLGLGLPCVLLVAVAGAWCAKGR